MKRDLEYLRKMLITIEEADYDKILSNTDFMTDKSSDEEFILASFHISLLLDADFIELEIEPIYAHSNWAHYRILRLTNNGCDFLDSIRDDTIWSKTKTKLGDLFSSATFTILSQTAQSIIKNQLNI